MVVMGASLTSTAGVELVATNNESRPHYCLYQLYKKSSSSDNSNLKLRITAILIIAVDSPGLSTGINGTRLSFSQVCLYILL